MAKKKTENIKAAPVLRTGSGGGGDQPTPAPEQTETRTYQVMDPWKDRGVVNLVDVKSVDGAVTEVKVNGEPAGGGGSSDFSTAQLTLNGTGELKVAWCSSDPEDGICSSGYINESGTYTVILFKGNAFVNATSTIGNITISGNIEEVDDKMYNVTGNCTITVTP